MVYRIHFKLLSSFLEWIRVVYIFSTVQAPRYSPVRWNVGAGVGVGGGVLSDGGWLGRSRRCRVAASSSPPSYVDEEQPKDRRGCCCPTLETKQTMMCHNNGEQVSTSYKGFYGVLQFYCD